MKYYYYYCCCCCCSAAINSCGATGASTSCCKCARGGGIIAAGAGFGTTIGAGCWTCFHGKTKCFSEIYGVSVGSNYKKKSWVCLRKFPTLCLTKSRYSAIASIVTLKRNRLNRSFFQEETNNTNIVCCAFNCCDIISTFKNI